MLSLDLTERFMKEKLENRAFDSYAVCVGKCGEEKTLFSENVNEDTYFDIASMGKVLVTTTLLLKALSEKRLTLEDTLDMYFEGVPEEKRKITLKQMLTHTSGIVRYNIPPEIGKKGREAVIDFILSKPLAYAPGTSGRYSCNAMILLGYIAEKIYGTTLETAFNERIKKPLGYTRSKFNIEKDAQNAAICYRWENADDIAHPWDDENVRAIGTSCGNGGQFFTLRDIRTFVKAVLAKSELLYSKDLFDLAEQDLTGGVADPWGLGWLIVDESYPQTGKLFPNGSFGHCGHTGTSMFMNRSEDLYVIILTNATRFLNMRNCFNGYNYEEITKLREEIHNEISKDLGIKGRD